MTFTHALATNNYGPAKFIVSSSAANGTHTTIASALTAASSGDTIFIRPGTYTENLTLKAGINLCAYGPTSSFGVASPGRVIINGTCTLTTAGTVGIKDIVLQTNGATAALAVTGSAASIVILENCFLNCTGNTGVTFSSSSASAQILFLYCSGDITTTGIALFNHSSAGVLRFLHSQFGNSGLSTTANTVSAGFFGPNWSFWGNGLTVSNAAQVNGAHIHLNMAAAQTCITLTDTASVTLLESNLVAGTSSAVSIGSGTTFTLHHGLISSSNASPVAGSGNFNYTSISFNSGVGIAGTVVHANIGVDYGQWNLIQTLTASASANLEFKNLATTYTRYVFIINNIKAATNAQPLEMTVSGDNGGSYAASGYTGGLNYNPFNSATVTNFFSTTYAPIASNSTTGDGVSGTVYCIPGHGRYFGTTTYGSNDTGNTVTATIGGGTGVVFNAFKFLFASGNITSGTISLYGISI